MDLCVCVSPIYLKYLQHLKNNAKKMQNKKKHTRAIYILRLLKAEDYFLYFFIEFFIYFSYKIQFFVSFFKMLFCFGIL